MANNSNKAKARIKVVGVNNPLKTLTSKKIFINTEGSLPFGTPVTVHFFDNATLDKLQIIEKKLQKNIILETDSNIKIK